MNTFGMSLWTFSVFFLWGLLVTPISINIAKRFRILDFPGGRKIHDTVVPYGGGLVLWTGYILWTLFFMPQMAATGYYGLSVTIIFLIGYLDDITPIKPVLRLALHFTAAVLAMIPFHIDWPTKILLVIWLTGMTNAYNLIDGINGLCLMLFLSAALVVSLESSNISWIPFIGLALGLLRWNFPKASTFLGDGGSTLLGFIFSSHFILSFPERITAMPNIVTLAVVLFILGGIPASDTIFAIVRRSINHGSPFVPDRHHLHHRLLDMGLPTWAVVVTLSILHALLLMAGMSILGKFA